MANDPVNFVDPLGLEAVDVQAAGEVIGPEDPLPQLGATDCYYRTYLAAGERYAGRNFTAEEMLDQAGHHMEQGHMEENYRVHDQAAIVTEALERLGIQNAEVSVEYKPSEAALTGDADYTVRGMWEVKDEDDNVTRWGHGQLGDGEGNLLFDPWPGGRSGMVVDYYQEIYIEER